MCVQPDFLFEMFQNEFTRYLQVQTQISHKGIKSGVNKMRKCDYDKASSRLVV